MDVVDTRQAHPLRDHAEAHAVVLLARVGAVAGAMQVQDHVVLPAPVAHALDRGVADHQVHHHDHRAELLRELGAPVHLFHRAGGDVEVAALDLAGAALALLTASITNRNRSRQCMKGCELMFSSSFMKSSPPRRPS
jgi:predicted RNA-binding Zn ribbon-like protein